MKFKFYISIFIFLLSTSFIAQEATLKASVSKNKLGLNQRVRVEFSIDKQGGENFTPPNFTNFKVVGGPSQSVSQSWINGKVSFRQSYTYIIQPKKKENFLLEVLLLKLMENY
nr:BatD [uncultured bacterium]